MIVTSIYRRLCFIVTNEVRIYHYISLNYEYYTVYSIKTPDSVAIISMSNAPPPQDICHWSDVHQSHKFVYSLIALKFNKNVSNPVIINWNRVPVVEIPVNLKNKLNQCMDNMKPFWKHTLFSQWLLTVSLPPHLVCHLFPQMYKNRNSI